MSPSLRGVLDEAISTVYRAAFLVLPNTNEYMKSGCGCHPQAVLRLRVRTSERWPITKTPSSKLPLEGGTRKCILICVERYLAGGVIGADTAILSVWWIVYSV
jgi:hypothetical protein